MRHASLEGHELAAIYRSEFGLPIFTSLRAYLERRQRSGALRHIDAGITIVALVGMADYYVWNTGPGQTLNDTQASEAFLSILMNGICNPSGSQKKKNSK
jgi:hypothetical protein